MSAYTCRKPATFAGKKYMPGDTIPAEAIPAERVGAVIRMGLIAERKDAPEPTDSAEALEALQAARTELEAAATREAELREELDRTREALEAAQTAQDGAGAPGGIVIPLTRDGEPYDVTASPESIKTAAAVLQLTVEQAAEQIAVITDDTALVLIHGLDSRKGIQTAAESRAKALAAEGGEGAG